MCEMIMAIGDLNEIKRSSIIALLEISVQVFHRLKKYILLDYKRMMKVKSVKRQLKTIKHSL